MTKALAESVKKLGAYETLTCIANAFEMVGIAIDNDHRTGRSGQPYHDAATTIDEVVKRLSGGKRGI